ncbi:M23 family metallopeptidase [Paenibacillus sp. MDMC362]|uniref:M23 family metallopeptidase n=1 Tax=Paenibacillus sp. MDMC362 TaxID=2977365 RepID=UPI000DC45A4F|nr:M23 family metallopeptidase [Paenibacillus sp. MDMC362]RAR40792.1 M23 family peptidase [Paenibacillus sp. MDMC362]
MDIKTSVKNRREARIRELLEGESSPALHDKSPWGPVPEKKPAHPSLHKTGFIQEHRSNSSPLLAESEPDPERLWKQRHRGWYGAPEPGDPEEPPRKASFLSGLVRRIIVSALVFGLAWGVFSFQQPWALRTQAFIVEGLSHEMDFQAAQVWYEEHFGSAPSFIPIFGQTDEHSTKVNAGTSLVPPLSGKMVQSFAVDLKGIVLEAGGGSLADRAVKSIETGRVLEVKEHPENGISILIQHTGERKAIYSRLAETGLKVNDWVQGGDIVGTLASSSSGSPPSLYFELKEGDRGIDPAEVIPFD